MDKEVRFLIGLVVGMILLTAVIIAAMNHDYDIARTEACASIPDSNLRYICITNSK